MRRFFRAALFSCAFPAFLPAAVMCEPVVIKAAAMPALLGAPISRLRLVTGRGTAVPFQIDELTIGGEYVCASGLFPNADSGAGILAKQDEIVFLWEDADTAAGFLPENGTGITAGRRAEIAVSHRSGDRRVVRRLWLVDDPQIAPSPVRYLSYNDSSRYLRTPYYHARFGRDRFHFVSAGFGAGTEGAGRDSTNELRVEIEFRTLWGLLPIKYNEESIVCRVARYKAGPIRLIRRGYFYLKLGFGLKGSRAAVLTDVLPAGGQRAGRISTCRGICAPFSARSI